MHTLRMLIVDDEPLIRIGIRRALAGAAGIEIVGECGSGEEAIEAIESEEPDLVVLDVQMPGCNGLDVVRRIGPDRMPAVVFVTAYDEYAVQAFEVNAVDYVLKPFDPERLLQAIARARARIAAKRDDTLGARLQALLDARDARPPDRLVVRNGERFEFVPLDAIDWIEAADNYVQLHCGPKRHLLNETMTNLERRLDPSRFLRVHRSRMVNTSRIVAVHVLMGGTYELELRGGLRLTTGRQYRSAVQQLIRA
ncbi:MAG TPA: LytTR family DNA-binding domain-containing protein [Vicinamibacterales bacterium]|nr:LytTR family DNA-binding domain-containing protein [Vicinamibacterales bacterium]